MMVGLLALFLARPDAPALRVCADPNNLPFSNARAEGFEDRLAAWMGRSLRRPVSHTYWPQRRGFLRNTLDAGACDVVMGLPAGMSRVRTTRPYYRGSYVFASRADRRLTVRSFDDPALRKLRIGVSLVGDDGANPPPAHALARRGIVDNVVGFTVYGDYRQDSPPTRVMEALEAGTIDVAVVWGPLAGAWARQHHVALSLVPTPAADQGLPLVFDIALGVRRDDEGLQRRLDQLLRAHHAEVDRLLKESGVPRVR
jgi:mxaJ protein